MLQKLFIQNYAIIDELSILFSANLNVITGETGAGKSIVMGALSLILGERAESSVLRNKEKKCVVEGCFAGSNSQVNHFLNEHELDGGDELIIRREIAANGKSRAFVNDTPVNLNQLKELSSMLVDLHQQFDTLELGDQQFQREVVDALADNAGLLQSLKVDFATYQRAKQKLEQLKHKQQEANATLDYNKFLFDELEAASFKPNELEDAEAELKLLSNAEEIKQQLGALYFELKESDQPIVQQIKMLVNKMHAVRQFHPEIEELENRLQSAQYELADIADNIDRISDSVQYNPDRITFINERMAIGYKLLKKHGVALTNELLAIQQNLQSKLDDVLDIGETIKSKETEVTALLTKCEELANSISAKRKKAIQPLTDQVNQLLVRVGMLNACIKIELPAAGLHQYGKDHVVFLFDANKSNRFEPLSKVASGGELSRIMLCIKSLVAKKLKLPVLIFDEIDTGISGEAAKQVAMIMKDLSKEHQVITITHQPQIAAKASAHYFVYKAEKAKQVTTSMRRLSENERVEAIAQMLTGENPTPVALKNAREMIGME